MCLILLESKLQFRNQVLDSRGRCYVKTLRVFIRVITHNYGLFKGKKLRVIACELQVNIKKIKSVCSKISEITINDLHII